MEEEAEDYPSWLQLDSCWSRDRSSLFEALEFESIPDRNDAIESVNFEPDAASTVAPDVDSFAGDWILEFPLFKDTADPQWIREILAEHQSFQGAHHDPQHEFSSGCGGACKCRKENRGLFVYVHITHCDHSACEESQEQAHEAARTPNGCPMTKAGRSSNSRPTLIGKLKKQKNDSNFVDKFVVEAKSAHPQNVGDEPLRDDAPASPMAKKVASYCGQGSTLAAPVSVQKKTGVPTEMRSWKSTFEVTRPRVANDGKAPRIPNWSNEELSALLLSKIKALEGGCGGCDSEQGLRGRTPLGKKLEANIAAKGRSVRLFSKYPPSQTNTDVEDDESQNCSSSFSVEDDVPSGNESSATSEPQAESSTGDSSAP